MSGLLAALPLHLACQIISPENCNNGNLTINASQMTYATVLPEGYTAFPDVGRAYRFYTNRLSWNAARKQCMADGASLAIVDSFKKIGYILGLTSQKFGGHTGIHRLFDGTEWLDIKNGKTVGFIPWKPDADVKAGTGQCVAMWFDGSGVGPWVCSNVLPAICEFPMFKSLRSELQSTEGLESSIISN